MSHPCQAKQNESAESGFISVNTLADIVNHHYCCSFLDFTATLKLLTRRNGTRGEKGRDGGGGGG